MSSVRVAVDAMGGDHAPAEVVAGTLAWARAHPADAVLLVGIPERIRAVADGPMPANVEIVAASQVVEMDESPALALKAKKDSSIMVAMDLVKQGRADALVTAGHSGAGMAAAVLRLGRLPGVDRPALAVQMVTETGPFVLLDIGANMDSSGHNLYQFAHMGSLYAEKVLGVEKPRVALLSIGEEKGKGDQAVQQATQLLDEDGSLNFVGNVEGRDLVKHMADVAVCDAMVGNVTMKFFEGLATFIFNLWRREFRRLPLGPDRLPVHEARGRSDPGPLRLREARRLAAPRGQGHGLDHARLGQAAHVRVRGRGRGRGGAGPHPGVDRGRVSRPVAPPRTAGAVTP